MTMKAYLKFSDIELMEKVASGQRDRLLIRLLPRLGCRISEVLALKVEDIDFKQDTVTICISRRVSSSPAPGASHGWGIGTSFVLDAG